uniref:Transmembrane and ubiquitin-like domain-containing protein 1 n=1 Tax=Pogona vitticeps TaxID=103695 RepID=A0ABM5GM79_9SAUR
MALIEGVGDEVTVLFGLLALLLVVALAWFSTRTGDRAEPLFAASPAGAAAAGQLPEGEPLEREAAAAVAAAAAMEEEEEEDQPPDRSAKGGRRPSTGQVVPDGREGAVAGALLRPKRDPGLPQSPLPAPVDRNTESSPPRDDAIILRLKFLNDTERLARVRPEDTVGTLKRAHFPGQEQLVRLIYQGQLLRDDSQTLAALHLTHNSVVHCHISQHRPGVVPAGVPPGAAHVDATHAALNMGSLMVPLFVLMLGTLWYFQLQYRHVFTATATTCLAGLTLVFSFVAFAMYRR